MSRVIASTFRRSVARSPYSVTVVRVAGRGQRFFNNHSTTSTRTTVTLYGDRATLRRNVDAMTRLIVEYELDVDAAASHRAQKRVFVPRTPARARPLERLQMPRVRRARRRPRVPRTLRALA
jgi:hypothetical protein